MNGHGKEFLEYWHDTPRARHNFNEFTLYRKAGQHRSGMMPLINDSKSIVRLGSHIARLVQIAIGFCGAGPNFEKSLQRLPSPA